MTLEDIHEDLARRIDAVGPAQAPLFLAKVALALAHALDDPERARTLIAMAAEDLDPPPSGAMPGSGGDAA